MSIEGTSYHPRRTHDLLVFGQGPVIDFKTRDKPNPTDTSSNIDGNLWLNSLAQAAKVVYHHPHSRTREVVVLGGKTGGNIYESEAEVTIRKVTTGENPVPVEATRGEHSSTNTLENLVNYCNEVLDNPDVPKGESLDILGTPYHLNRMKLLMKLFAIPYDNVISSEGVLLFDAQVRGGDVADKRVTDIQRRMDIDEAGREPLSKSEAILDRKAREKGIPVGYYDGQKGTEKKTILRRMQEEDLWTRALLTLPDYSLPYFARIQSDARLLRVLRNYETNFFPEREGHPSALSLRGIDLGHDTPEEIRTKISAIERYLPDEKFREAWISENTIHGWPAHVEVKLKNIFDRPAPMSAQTS